VISSLFLIQVCDDIFMAHRFLGLLQKDVRMHDLIDFLVCGDEAAVNLLMTYRCNGWNC
jgi:hypothetical protein